MITADGKLLRLNKDQHADLFWGARGAASNFGIVTQLKNAIISSCFSSLWWSSFF